MPTEQVSAIPTPEQFAATYASMKTWCGNQDKTGWPNDEVREAARLVCWDLWCCANNKPDAPGMPVFLAEFAKSSKALAEAQARAHGR